MSSSIEIQRVCEHCGDTFTARTTKTRFCSHKCNSRAYKAAIKNQKVEQSNVETQRIISKPIEEIKAKPFLSIAETCQLLGISRSSIYRMMESEKLAVGKIGGRVIIKRTDIDSLINSSYK